jgi:hypothetical protein
LDIPVPEQKCEREFLAFRIVLVKRTVAASASGSQEKQQRHGFQGLTQIQNIYKSVKSVKSVALLLFLAQK